MYLWVLHNKSRKKQNASAEEPQKQPVKYVRQITKQSTMQTIRSLTKSGKRTWNPRNEVSRSEKQY